MAMLEKAKAAFDAGKVDQGEGYLDAALKSVIASPKVSTPKQLLPTSSVQEKSIDLFEEPQQLTILGYDDDCMEPSITGDGQYLFFNNSNDARVATHIHYAKRVGKDRFQHLGLLAGTVSNKKDMAPATDDAKNFYFTSTRTFEEDSKSIFVGTFAQNKVTGVHAIDGTAAKSPPFFINMDCCISSDGKTLIVSKAKFRPGIAVPTESDLVLARARNGNFDTDPDSAIILENINTPALEYAPWLSHDGLSLYFSRASELMVGSKSQGANLRILVATRKALDEQFREPQAIRSIQGFVEAPTLTSDGSEILFHKKVGDKFRLFHAYRKPHP
jgi:hypothetical protein